MTVKTVHKNNLHVAVIQSDDPIITDVQSALDFMASVRFETGCDRVVLNKAAVVENFFILSTGLAGEILQKFTNYQFKIAIFGDYSGYTSKPLKDFIYESNRGCDVFFVATQEEAIAKLTK